MTAESTPGTYRIGKVSRLTGISPDTLRIWERRYEAVVPHRSDSGGRLYSGEDIARLKLMKRLVDAGDAISAIAGLERDELEQRISETRETVAPAAAEGPCRVIVIGKALASMLQHSKEPLTGIELSGHYASARDMLDHPGPTEAEMILIEQPTLQLDTARQVVDLINRTNVMHIVVVYRFASQPALDLLPRNRCSMLRAPLEPLALQALCTSLFGAQAVDTHTPPSVDSGAQALPPPRRFDDGKLAKIAAISPTIKCECPHHLAELITSLSAFERYSSECESRSLEDAELHEYLGKTASNARHMIEDALERVIEIENIEL